MLLTIPPSHPFYIDLLKLKFHPPFLNLFFLVPPNHTCITNTPNTSANTYQVLFSFIRFQSSFLLLNYFNICYNQQQKQFTYYIHNPHLCSQQAQLEYKHFLIPLLIVLELIFLVRLHLIFYHIIKLVYSQSYVQHKDIS